LSDNLSWHWCFLINVPVGLISLVLIYMIAPSSSEKKKDRELLRAKGLNLDVVGFQLIGTFLGGLEVILDRGHCHGDGAAGADVARGQPGRWFRNLSIGIVLCRAEPSVVSI